ncbi:hypothetical protein CVCC1112_2908 [Paenarthrobacter nicotinovorans]|nr:hypothetical protein CVCC1112_2908 [Paenarthrobacter nicotinovorans]
MELEVLVEDYLPMHLRKSTLRIGEAADWEYPRPEPVVLARN